MSSINADATEVRFENGLVLPLSMQYEHRTIRFMGEVKATSDFSEVFVWYADDDGNDFWFRRSLDNALLTACDEPKGREDLEEQSVPLKSLLRLAGK